MKKFTAETQRRRAKRRRAMRKFCQPRVVEICTFTTKRTKDTKRSNVGRWPFSILGGGARQS